MSFESGGRADKFGNRYESRVIIEFFLKLLQEQIYSIEVESIGDDEKGVDFYVKSIEDEKKLYQCKARNASEDSWSAGDLNKHDIFNKSKVHIDNGHSYCFISAISAANINDITLKARNSSDYSEFFKSQIVGSKEISSLKTIVRGFQLDFDTDQKKIYNYLKKIEFLQIPDDSEMKNRLLLYISCNITGNEEMVYNLLKEFLIEEDYLGREITSNTLWSYLNNKGHYALMLSKDTRIIPKMREQNTLYSESINDQGLINSKVITRPEKDIILEALENNEIIFIHGDSGSGKSVLLYDVYKHLEAHNKLCFAMRLDRLHFVGNNTRQLGEAFDLPISPVSCLKAFNNEDIAVLFIDQLDAVRSVGSGTQLLDITKKMINEVINYSDDENRLRVVISCRTFDFETDNQIQAWIKQFENKLFQVKLGGFEEELSKGIIGKNYNLLSKKQKTLLKNPQNIKLWKSLRLNEDHLPNIDNFYSLIDEVLVQMRRSVELKVKQSDNKFKKLNSYISKYMDEKERFDIPKRKLESFSEIYLEACVSCGLLQYSSQKSYSYTHQSFIDHFVAKTVMELIDEDSSIVKWLGARETQLLNKRRQLEQVLLLLKEEDNCLFEKSCIEILSDIKVRFLLKQAAMGVLSLHSNYSDTFIDMLLEVNNGSVNLKHLITLIFWGKAFYIKELLDKGIILEWLHNKQVDQYLVCSLLSNISTQLPEETYSFYMKLLKIDDSFKSIVAKSLPVDSSFESIDFFLLRINLFNEGLIGDYFLNSLPDLAEKYPNRCLKLIQLTLSNWKYDPKLKEIIKKYNGYHCYEEGNKKIYGIVDTEYLKVWDTLITEIKRLTDHIKFGIYYFSRWDEDFYHGEKYSFEMLCINLIKFSAKRLSKDGSKKLFDRLLKIQETSNKILNNIFWYSLQFLGLEYSDFCIDYILSQQKNMDLFLDNKKRIQLIYSLVAKFSVTCSIEKFKSLETFILKFQEIRDKNFYRDVLKARISGDRNCLHGKFQYLLLPALFNKRTSLLTKNEIKIYSRKFKNISIDHLYYDGSKGGMVGSKLTPNLYKISDNSWINIITKGKSVNRGWSSIIQHTSDSVLESSVRMFSSSFEQIAARFPERFFNLTKKFPENVDSHYINAILSIAIKTEPDDNWDIELKRSWKAISLEDITLFILKYYNTITDRNSLYTLFRLIKSRYKHQWSNEIIQLLIQLSKKDVQNIEDYQYSDLSKLHLDSNNLVQCKALRAIAALLFNDYYIPYFINLIKELSSSKNILIRYALIDTILPLLNFDREVAWNLFKGIINEDYFLAATSGSVKIMNHTVLTYSGDVKKILLKMKSSPLVEVSKVGYAGIWGYGLFHDLYTDVIIDYMNIDKSIKNELINLSLKYINYDLYFNQCFKLLEIFLNDEEEEVRQCAAGFLYRNIDNQENLKNIMILFINSKSFRGRFHDIFRKLKSDYYKSLQDFADTIFLTCETSISKIKLNSKDIGNTFDIPRELFPILLSLYDEQLNKNKSISLQCLDYIDRFLYHHVGFDRYTSNMLTNL